MRRSKATRQDNSNTGSADDLRSHEETIVLERSEPLREWMFEPRIRVEPGTELMAIMGKDDDANEDLTREHG